MLKKLLIICLSFNIICCGSPQMTFDMTLQEEVCLTLLEKNGIEDTNICGDCNKKRELFEKERIWSVWIDDMSESCIDSIDVKIEKVYDNHELTVEEEELLLTCTDGLDNEDNRSDLYIDCNDYYCSKNEFIISQNICQRAN